LSCLQSQVFRAVDHIPEQMKRYEHWQLEYKRSPTWPISQRNNCANALMRSFAYLRSVSSRILRLSQAMMRLAGACRPCRT
jgi:hypothetical protein